MRRWLTPRPRRYYGEPQRNIRGCAAAVALLLLAAGVIVLVAQLRDAGVSLASLNAKITALLAAGRTGAAGSPVAPAVATVLAPQSAAPTQSKTLPKPQHTAAQLATQPGLCPYDCEALRGYLVELVNRDRVGQGLPALAWHDAAGRAAQAHAHDMLRNRYFSHTALDGSDVGQRLQAAQAGALRAWGENIWTFSSGNVNGQAVTIVDFRPLVEQAQESWMNSPGHRANLLNPAFTHIGVGIGYDASAGEMRMVQVFATPVQ